MFGTRFPGEEPAWSSPGHLSGCFFLKNGFTTSGLDLVSNEFKSGGGGGTLEGHYSHSVRIVSFHCFFFSSARALLLTGQAWASRPATSHRLLGGPLPFPSPGLDRGGGSSRAAHQSKRLGPPLPPASPAPRCRPPIALRARPAGSPNRGQPGPPVPRPSRARRRLRGRPRWAWAFSEWRRTASGPGCRVRSAGGGAAARGVLGRVGERGGCHRPAGKAPQLRRGPRRGTQDRRGGGAPAARAWCPPGGGRGRPFPAGSVPVAPPGEAPPRAPARPLGVPSAAPDSPARAARLPGAGACARRGRLPRPPAGRGRGRPPPSASLVRQPRPVARLRAPRGPRCGMLPSSAAGLSPPATPTPASWAMPRCLHAGEAPGHSEPLRAPAPRQ